MKKYQSYKPSGVDWIGEIPEEWEIKPLYSECYQSKLKNDNKSLPILSLSYGKIKIRDIESNQGLLPESFDNYQKVKKGFIVLRLTDLQNDKTSLRVGFSELEGLITPVYISIGCKENIFDRFLFYQLYDSDVRKILYSLGGGLRQTLRYDELSRYPILLPKITEQHQIVEFLDSKTELIDKLISTKERKITLLKEQRTSIINQVVTKGLNPNVKMKDSGVEWIGEIPEHWIKSKVKYVSSIFGRIGYRGYTVDDIVNEGEGVITISPSNIQNDLFTISGENTYITYEKYEESPEIKIYRNDIILVKTGSTIGKTSIIPDGVPDMTINPQLVVLKNIKIDNSYFYFQTVCEYFKKSFFIEQTGSTTPTISQEKINNFPILIPSNQEQLQIVEYLDSKTKEIDEMVQLEQKKIDLLKEYRQSLISEVVTGKIKVTN